MRQNKYVLASVGTPGSKDTYEWYVSCAQSKVYDDLISYEYIDIDQPPKEQKYEDFIEHMIEEYLFYPMAFVIDAMVAEGVPRLKIIYRRN